MDELKQALYALIHQTGLSEAEAAHLTLEDLHLAGTDPNISVWDEETGQQRTVHLSASTRNAVVTWMLLRPDRPVKLLFPGNDEDGFTEEEIKEMLADYTPPDEAQPASSPPPVSAQTVLEEGLPTMGPWPSRPTSPPFRTTPPPFSPEQIGQERPADAPEVTDPTSGPERTTPPSSRQRPDSPPELAEATPESTSKASRRRSYLSIIIGVLAILGCGGLAVWGLTFFPSQMSRLTGEGETPVAEVEATATSTATTSAVSTSPVGTPTVQPTATPEPIELPTSSPTDTPPPELTESPAPTNTPTSIPTETPSPAPTDTPTPTPTDTPQPAPPPTSQPAPPGASGFKYSAPQLISPEPNARFIAGNTIDLKWASVGELANNEQYAVRLVYFHETEPVYKGDQLQDTQWTIPLELYHEADGPKFEYFWYVYVERVQSDGTGIPISPESEHRFFTWE